MLPRMGSISEILTVMSVERRVIKKRIQWKLSYLNKLKRFKK